MRFVRNNRYIRSFQQGACIRPTWRARCLSDVACGLTAVCCCARRSWIPARREGVLEANGVFSSLAREGCGLQERRITRIRRRQMLWRKMPPHRKAMSDRQRSFPGTSLPALPQRKTRRPLFEHEDDFNAPYWLENKNGQAALSLILRH
jgi:hypothetical protein